MSPDSSAFPARLERFATVESTQAVVRAWLDAGAPEVAVAVSDEQTAGRARLDRTWTAPPGAALLCSIGFRPAALTARHAWRLGAVVSLAMLDA
ncbi:MAG: biotin--[acetyl-CoA-carboxylase] ligase, partial [Candidatus Limnocylindrales bacterium]